jgi:hypothetical protein
LLALLIQLLLAVAALLAQALQTAASAAILYLIQSLLLVEAAGVTMVEPLRVVPVVQVAGGRLCLALVEQVLLVKEIMVALVHHLLEVQQAAVALVV